MPPQMGHFDRLIIFRGRAVKNSKGREMPSLDLPHLPKGRSSKRTLAAVKLFSGVSTTWEDWLLYHQSGQQKSLQTNFVANDRISHRLF